MRRFIDRIAARLGYERARPLLTELIVFRDFDSARAAGFSGQRHPRHKHLIAWWPGSGVRGLMGRPWQRVTINGDMIYHRTDEGRLADILRARQKVWGDLAIWIEL